MPLDPVAMAAQLNTILSWCASGLDGFLAKRAIPADVRAAMLDSLTSAQAFVNSPRWAVWIEELNGSGK